MFALVGTSEAFVTWRSLLHRGLGIAVAAAVAAVAAAAAAAAVTAVAAVAAAISQGVQLVEMVAEVVIVFDAHASRSWNQHRVRATVSHRWTP